MSHGNSDTVW